MNLLLNIACADAYGRSFEFNTPEFIHEYNDLVSYKHRSGEEQNGIGIYTDDTQMSIAIAEHLIYGILTSQEEYARFFLQAYLRDPHEGYSKRLKAALSCSNSANEFISSCKQAGLSSNGSVMRAIPIGLISDPKEVMYRTIVHTSTTHGHIDAVNAAVAVALTAHYLYHIYIGGDEYVKYLDWMKDQMGEVFTSVYNSYSVKDPKPLQCDAKSTAALSIKLAWSKFTASNMIKKAIDIGGDVDSSACISMGLYTLRCDAILDLPDFMTQNLENGSYGRDYIMGLDKKLFEKFPRNKV